MKKILTLLVMFLATASILTAQTPKLSYQMIVRNQCADARGEFEANDLVYSTRVHGELTILQDGGVKYRMQINDSTNMNGMLSLTLEDQANAEVKLYQIDWSKAYIVVKIPTYCINDSVEILPVPYALSAGNIDTFLTTQEIYNYLSTVTLPEVDQIITDFWGNAAFSQALVDTLKNYAKANYGAARNLALYFLEQADAQDADDVYNNIPQDVKGYVADKLVEFAKNHYDAALEIGLYFIDKTTKQDVVMLLDTAMKNPVSAQLMTKVVDTVLHFFQTPDARPYVVKAFNKAVDLLQNDPDFNATKLQILQDSLKQWNLPVYEEMRNILDDLLYDYLANTFNAVSDSCALNDDKVAHPIDLCKLFLDIENVKEYGFDYCPTLGTTTHTPVNTPESLPVTLTTTITPDQGNQQHVALNTPQAKYYYILSYPNSIYRDKKYNDTIEAYHNPTDSLKFTLNLNSNHIGNKGGMTIVVTPYVTGLKCRTREIMVEGADTIKIVSCPMLVVNGLTHTSDGALDLDENKGIKLTAKVDRNYGNIDTVGFLISLEPFTSTTSTPDTIWGTIADNALSFSGILKMNYCAKHVYVKAFLKCENGLIRGDEEIDFNIRGPKLEITANPTDAIYTPSTAVKLRSTATFNVGSNAWTCLPDINNNAWPTLEQIIAAAQNVNSDITTCVVMAQQYGNITPVYSWKNISASGKNDMTHPCTYDTVCLVAPDYALPGDTIRYEATVSIRFIDTNCVVTDTIEVYRGFLCGDTLRDVQRNKYATQQFGNLCWTRSNMRSTKAHNGVDIDDNVTEEANISTKTTATYYHTSSLVELSDSIKGLLYNQSAAQIVCPKGWRLPTDVDWRSLEQNLNNHQDTLDYPALGTNDSLTSMAYHLIKNSAWNISGGTNNNNDSGFDAYPVGVRHVNTLIPQSELYPAAKMTGFWSSTKKDNSAKYYSRYIYPDMNMGSGSSVNPYVIRTDTRQYIGLSVRCVKDAAQTNNPQ